MYFGINKDHVKGFITGAIVTIIVLAIIGDEMEAQAVKKVEKEATKDYGSTIQDYSKAIELNPNDVGAYLLRGLARYENRDYYNAKDDFDKVVRLTPTDAYAYQYRGNTMEKLGDATGACEDFYKCKELGSVYADELILKYCASN